jgi:hypothetical protein
LLQNSASWVLERLETLERDQLIQVILDQHRMIEELKAEVDRLKGRHSAAPFSKGKGKANPQPPGRKPGQGFFRFRSAPESAGPVVEVAAPCNCPDCGGEMGEARSEVVSLTDVGSQPVIEVRRYAVETRRCGSCGRRVRGSHPELPSDQRGATAHRLGPRIRTLAHVLHFAHGVPVRKIPAILEQMTGIGLTQSAITQDALKQAEGAIGEQYRKLRAAVAREEVIHTDDTGWRVGGRTAFLMAFVNRSLAVYQIRSRHRNEEVRELIAPAFKGTLICDRGKSYDAEALDGIRQQKCLAHLLRNAADVAEKKTARAKHFSLRLKELLKQALALRSGKAGMSPRKYRKQAKTLRDKLSLHLRHRLLRDPDNQTLLNGVGYQDDRGNLLRFLDRDEVEPTNNRAERALRPAVIARKLSHCSRTRRGADAFEAFTSVIQTLRKNHPARLTEALAQLIAQAPAASP